jgi:hypothetical protein
MAQLVGREASTNAHGFGCAAQLGARGGGATTIALVSAR